MNLTRDLAFMALYFLGIVGIYYWRKKQNDPALFFYGSTWSFGVLLTYLIVLEISYHSLFFMIPLFFFSVFAFFYFTKEGVFL